MSARTSRSPRSLVIAALLFVGGMSLHGAKGAEASPRLRFHKPPSPSSNVKLPPAAQKIVDAFAKKRAAVYRKAEARLAPLRRAAVRKLKRLQDRFCRQAKLDEALAVRAKIYQVRGIRRDPGALRAQPGDVGKTFLYDIRGATSGSVWGSQIYTTDSHLATAAVHAGVLKAGQRGVVKVQIVPGQPSYAGSRANGVTSMGYGSWGLSFTIERAPNP